ncbi:hypothetical protein CYMTET_47921 [Cymbomonas tetramitiformis]|uniref:Glycosyl transferase CAP10 domain-containing protein n=1 Tax=Cymbomonas tetramitiformis TaxID=36881 RepID=A0AAE0BUN6_9CHLO|nr:hypothetical protein CYMTET_47921 [Cymbomonas tetramitiformis]
MFFQRCVSFLPSVPHACNLNFNPENGWKIHRLKESNKVTDHIWQQPADEELTRSLAQWKPGSLTEQAIFAAVEDVGVATGRNVSDPEDLYEHWQGMIIYNNSLYFTHVTWSQLGPGYKKKLFRNFMNSIVQSYKKDGCRLPDVFMMMNIESVFPSAQKEVETSNKSSSSTTARAPVMCIARNVMDAKKCTLVPNPYFKTLNAWQKMTAKIRRNCPMNLPTWRQRQDRALWRGKCGFSSCESSGPRMKLGMLSACGDNSQYLDVAFKEETGCHRMEIWVREKNCPWLTDNTSQLINKVLKGAVIDQASFCQAKYLVNMPGQYQGSYSRHLQYIMPTGSAILIWETLSEFDEFYYHHLRPGKDFLWVHGDKDNSSKSYQNATGSKHIVEVVKQLRQNERRAWRLGKAARRFFQHNLSADALKKFWLETIHMYAKLQGFAPHVPAEACAMTRDAVSDRIKQMVALREA